MTGLVREPDVLLLPGGVLLPGAVLTTLAHRHRVPGGQLAIHHDGRGAAVEFGELRHETGQLVTREAAFPIGSISKSFTATMAMVLVADGDVDPHAPIGTYLPELPAPVGQLTLHHLLSHTGGLTGGPDPERLAHSSSRRYVSDHCGPDALLLPAGAGFSYSNSGYVLAGRLIDVVTGMTWWEAVESIVLRPLRIEPAFVGRPAGRPPGRPVATGHSVNRTTGRTRPVEQFLAGAQAPAGGLAASATDLVALGLPHVGAGRADLLPARYAALMRQPVPGAEPYGLADGWGLGLAVFPDGWVGHDGNANGTACYLRIHPELGWVIGFTSNAGTGYDLWQALLTELAGMGLPIGPAEAPGPPTHRPGDGARTQLPRQARGDTRGQIGPPPGCAGRYTNGDVEYVLATGPDGALRLTIDGDPVAALVVHPGLTFSLWDETTGQVPGGRFLRDDTTGRIDMIQVGGRLARRAEPEGPHLG